MTSFPNPVKSTALIVYTPPQHPIAQARAYMEKMQNLFVESSFKTQMADVRLCLMYEWSYTNHGTGCDKKFFRTAYWEGKGVIPDIQITGDENALERAKELCKKKEEL